MCRHCVEEKCGCPTCEIAQWAAKTLGPQKCELCKHTVDLAFTRP